MTAKDFRNLYKLPMDIAKRRARIAKLEAVQMAGAVRAADVVQASHGEGNACINGHATVTGRDIAYDRREEQIRRLKELNAHKQQIYDEGMALVESCPDPRTRAALTAHCVEGIRYTEIACDMEEHGIHTNEDALRKSVDRWISKNFL